MATWGFDLLVHFKVLSAGWRRYTYKRRVTSSATRSTDTAITSSAHPFLVTTDELFPLDGDDKVRPIRPDAVKSDSGTGSLAIADTPDRRRCSPGSST